MLPSSFLQTSTIHGGESVTAREARLAAERAALEAAYLQARSGKGLELEAFETWCDELITKIPD